MKLISDYSIETADYIKKCIEWKISAEYNDNLLQISNFIFFIKLKFFNLNEVTKQTFEDYKIKPDDYRLRAMFEVCMEIGITENQNYRQELEQKIIEIKKIETQHAAPDQKIQEEKLTVTTNHDSGNEVLEVKEKHPVIVYWDFTKESQNALDYAIDLSKKINCSITLIHFANKGNEYIEAIKRLRIIVEKYFNEKQIKIHAKIKDKNGNLAQAIETTTDITASFLIIGTTGYAKHLNIIGGINIPTLIIQENCSANFDKILFPIDDRKEIKQNLVISQFINKFFKSKYFITRPENISYNEINQSVLNNQKFCEAFFKKNEIDFDVVKIDENKSFADVTIKAIKQLNPDIILVLPKDIQGIFGVNIGSDEKKIIENCNQKPIIFVNNIQALIPNFGGGIMW